MKVKSVYIYLLVAVVLLTFVMRIYLSFQTPHFEMGEAYFTYRQVDSIQEGFLPSYVDDLSYSGRTRIFPPVYYYLLSVFSLFVGTSIALKIIPNVLASFLVVIVYFIVLEMTRKKDIALFSSFAAGFIPVFFAGTVNSASIMSLTIPLIFYLVYCFIRIRDRKFLYQFLFFSFILTLTSAISFLFVFALLIYLMLVKLEYKVHSKLEVEVILFVTFMSLWINILIYKKAFLFHSYALIWQNIPSQILDSFFQQVDVLGSVSGIGLIPLLFGVYAVYRYMFKERDKSTYLLMAFALAVAVLLWFRLITLDIGLIFLGAILVILLGQSLNLMFKYIELSKVSRFSYLFWACLVVLLCMTSVLPSVARGSVSVYDSVNQDEIDALLWLRESTPKNSVILASVGEGNMITAVAKRRNVADDDFILIRAPEDIFEDIDAIYTSILKINAVELLNRYSVDYIYFSPRSAKEFGVSDLRFAEPDCFDLVHNSSVLVYEVKCEVKVS